MTRRKILLALLSLIFVAAFWLHESGQPPSDASVVENFNKHRADFETLRAMIQEDKNMVRVAEWGVETKESPIVEIPPQGPFPVDRYRKYLLLLKSVNGWVAAPSDGPNAEAWVGLWASGWAGDIRHVSIVWTDSPPANQVANLDAFYKSAKPRTPIYRHIDGNWYIWADW